MLAHRFGSVNWFLRCNALDVCLDEWSDFDQVKVDVLISGSCALKISVRGDDPRQGNRHGLRCLVEANRIFFDGQDAKSNLFHRLALLSCRSILSKSECHSCCLLYCPFTSLGAQCLLCGLLCFWIGVSSVFLCTVDSLWSELSVFSAEDSMQKVCRLCAYSPAYGSWLAKKDNLVRKKHWPWPESHRYLWFSCDTASSFGTSTTGLEITRPVTIPCSETWWVASEHCQEGTKFPSVLIKSEKSRPMIIIVAQSIRWQMPLYEVTGAVQDHKSCMRSQELYEVTRALSLANVPHTLWPWISAITCSVFRRHKLILNRRTRKHCHREWSQ